MKKRQDILNNFQQPRESIKAGNFLTNTTTLNFSRKTVALLNQKVHYPLNSILNQKHIKPP
jgi:hypothetical protein